MKTNLVIPKGHYCYDENGTCPYFSYVKVYDKIGEIQFPYCLLLKKGSMPNGDWKNNELDRLSDHFSQTNEELWSGILSLDILWDQCKECGINY